jgi:hypothetical protein
MLRAGASSALTNVALALFALIPIMPQLAAHINYDNLLMLLLAWLCLIVFRLTDAFRAKRVDARAVLLFVVLSLFISVVKYAALPLLLGAVLFLAWTVYRSFQGDYPKLYKGALGDFKRLSRNAKVALVGVALIGLGLFTQRYMVNIVQYGSPVPDCGKVLTVEQCSQYGPWGRDYRHEQSRDPNFQPNIFAYTFDWTRGMLHRLFFAVSGAGTRFANYIELPVITWTFGILAVAALVSVVAWWRRIFADSPYLVFLALMIGVYLVLLFADQFGMYRQTAEPVAINGRYLLPILPLLAIIVGKAFALTYARFDVSYLKPFTAAVVLLCFLQGGGMLTYLLRADSNWYWQNQTVRDANEAARKAIAPFVIEGDKYEYWPPKTLL